MRKHGNNPSEWKTPLRARVMAFLDIPAECAPGESQVSLAGNRELAVIGCRGVLEYSEAVVRLRVSNGVITVKGSGLCMRSLIHDQITVNGHIRTVVLGEEEG